MAPAETRDEALVRVIEALLALPAIDERRLGEIVRRHPKDGAGAFSKADIIQGFRRLRASRGWTDDSLVERLRMKPVRTRSGVAPVTLLTRPAPCPGRCVFCPNDTRMPKSYLRMEPGAQRAAQHRFDPYDQVASRLLALTINGHHVDKAELIVLGGTWSSYDMDYRRWFVTRALAALSDFPAATRRAPPEVDPFAELPPLGAGETYNEVVGRVPRRAEAASWAELEAAQVENETAGARAVGLVLETRPDHVTPAEVLALRRLGATKVQLGVQSTDDRILALNRRDHDLAATRRAFSLLRQAGFKILAHFMPNLLGADPSDDVEGLRRLFADEALRPDELKLYPCSLIADTELEAHHRAGRWRPYTRDELVDVLARCLSIVPRYVRVSRVIRDIPAHDILVGNRRSNLREEVEATLSARGVASLDLRARELGARAPAAGPVELVATSYRADPAEQCFLEALDEAGRVLGFLRLQLPARSFVPELDGAALIRELHVYGPVVPLGAGPEGRAQHGGLGRRLVEEAARRARAAGAERLAVISAIGTRGYYRALGFVDGELYQHRPLRAPA